VRNYSNDNCTVHWIYRKAHLRRLEKSQRRGRFPSRWKKNVDRVTAQSRAPVVGVARHFIRAL